MYKLIVILIPLLSQRHSQGFRDAISTECHFQSRKTGELFKKLTHVSSGVSLQHFNLNKTIVHTPPGTCHMKVCLFSRSMHLDWTPRLCTTTGSGIPTGQARNMEPFQGNKLLPNFPISCSASWEKGYQCFYSKFPNYVGKVIKMVFSREPNQR